MNCFEGYVQAINNAMIVMLNKKKDFVNKYTNYTMTTWPIFLLQI